MNAISMIKDKAKTKHRRVVLPEGTEPRMIKAAKKILAEEICSVTILGDENQIGKLAKENDLKLERIQVINPAKAPEFDQYAHEYYELRKAKGMTVPFASHHLQQFQKSSDRVGIMIRGKMVAVGTIGQLAQEKLGVDKGEYTLEELYMKYFREG